MSLVDDVRRQITERLKELKPLVDEYHQLEAMVEKLGHGDGGRVGRRPSGRRRSRPRVPPTAAGAAAPRGSGTRAAQALALVQAKPGNHDSGDGQGDGDHPQLPVSRAPRACQGAARSRIGREGLDRPPRLTRPCCVDGVAHPELRSCVFTVASIRLHVEKSLTSRPSTISHSPSVTHRKRRRSDPPPRRRSRRRERPSTPSHRGVPPTQSRTWSIAAWPPRRPTRRRVPR